MSIAGRCIEFVSQIGCWSRSATPGPAVLRVMSDVFFPERDETAESQGVEDEKFSTPSESPPIFGGENSLAAFVSFPPPKIGRCPEPAEGGRLGRD